MISVQIGSVKVGNDLPFVLIGGPCQIESEAHALEVAEELASICRRLGIPLIYKSSYDKANRTSGGAPRGVGMARGLAILAEVGRRFGVPTLTDVHDAGQCKAVAEAVDVIQIPAFLCRQTDLLIAAGETGAAVNVKKGQFLAPWDMKHVAAKIASTGNERILLTERGDKLRLQHADHGFSWSARDGSHRIPCGLRRYPFGAAARRPGRLLRWSA